MRPAFHNHPAQCKAGLGVIIFSGITGVVAVQRTTAAPATVAAPSPIRLHDHSHNRQKLNFHKALIVKNLHVWKNKFTSNWASVLVTVI